MKKEEILQNTRADYGKQIVSTLSTQLKNKFGKNFELRNVRRMMQFAEQFSNISIAVKKSLSFDLFFSPAQKQCKVEGTTIFV
ncbi:MAG: DUF1016 N-terminal domain-containing protein [Desulfobacterales bacterium]